ncbi:MAG: hypothetical protein AB2615_06235, partial [Candidatus Thiodiazotropha sp.]
TRPIMITAFALVCGSSVIFFDPIFQGMAISLASGVLVSTVLTLIVIPLGCIAASKDIIEVAETTAPAGSSLLETDGEVSAEAGVMAAASSAQADAGREPGAVARRSSLPMVIWGRVLAVITTLFYLIRGVFLLLWQMLKGLFRSAKPRRSGDAKAEQAEGGSSGGSGSGGGMATPQTGSPSAGGEDVSIAAAPDTRKSATAARVKTPPQSAPRKRAAPPSTAAEDHPAEQAGNQEATRKQAAGASPHLLAAAETKQPKSSAVKTKRETATVPKKSATAGAKQKRRPSTLKKKVVKKKAASAKRKGNGSPESTTAKTEPAAKQASNVTAFPIRRKVARRGIRLK